MKLSEEDRELLVELARLMMPIREICIIMGFEYEQFQLYLKQKDSEVYKIYYSNYLKSKTELHKSILDHAKNGSHPAQTLAQKFIDGLNMEQSDV
jgi:hypothetical protein